MYCIVHEAFSLLDNFAINLLNCFVKADFLCENRFGYDAQIILLTPPAAHIRFTKFVAIGLGAVPPQRFLKRQIV